LHSGAALLAKLPVCEMVHGAKVMMPTRNADRSRAQRHAEYPAQGEQQTENSFSPFLHRNRDGIEQMFCQLNDFRRVTTFRSKRRERSRAVCIAAAVSYWL
jgi:hypothetical protein